MSLPQPIKFTDLSGDLADIKHKIMQGIENVIDKQQFILGPQVAAVESRLADFAGSKHAICVSNGTVAIQLALMALDVGPGDEVLTVPFTFFGTIEPILQVGAKPVFVDIDPVTFCMSAADLRSKVTQKTKCILPVSLFGRVADLDRIAEVAELVANRPIPVIEDAAQSYGASDSSGRRSCSCRFNNNILATTSFYPAKPMGAFGDAGAIFTNDDTLAAKLRALRCHGEVGRYNHQFLGANARMNTFQAVVLDAKLDVFDVAVRKRQHVAELYSSAFQSNPHMRELISRGHVMIPEVTLDGQETNVWAQFTLRLDPHPDADGSSETSWSQCREFRKAVIDTLTAKGIPTSVHYPHCAHRLPAVRCILSDSDVALTYSPEAERAASQVLSLPMHPHLRHDEVLCIVSSLMEAVTAALSRVPAFSTLQGSVNSPVHVDTPIPAAIRSAFQGWRHDSSVVGDTAVVGAGTKIWHFCHVMNGAIIGQNCNIGQNCFVASGAVLGNGVKVQNNVSIYDGVIVHDNAFLGPSCVFTNDIFPRSFLRKEYAKTIVGEGASIGANSTIVCGNTLGRFCLVGAGAVVTKSVPDFAVAVGNPAKVRCWVDRAGEKLNFPPAADPNARTVESCSKHTGKLYRLYIHEHRVEEVDP